MLVKVLRTRCTPHINAIMLPSSDLLGAGGGARDCKSASPLKRREGSIANNKKSLDRPSTDNIGAGNRDPNVGNSARDLFYCVLEWLSKQATYHRNVARGLAQRRTQDTCRQSQLLLGAALTIMEHLLPLRFSCKRLPPPMVVLAYLLYPLDLTLQQVVS